MDKKGDIYSIRKRKYLSLKGIVVMQDEIIEKLLRWNVIVMIGIATIHYLSSGWYFDVIEVPLMIFFFIGKLLSIPQIWISLLVIGTARYLKT